MVGSLVLAVVILALVKMKMKAAGRHPGRFGGVISEQHVELDVARKFGQTPSQLFSTPLPPRRLDLGSLPRRTPETSAARVQAHTRGWQARRHREKLATAFYFDEVAFQAGSTLQSAGAPKVDVLVRTVNGFAMDHSRDTTTWLSALSSEDGNAAEQLVTNFLRAQFRTDDVRMHHRAECHPFAQLLHDYCALVERIFADPRAQQSATVRLGSLQEVVKLGVARITGIICDVLPPLQPAKHSQLVHGLVLDEVTSRLYAQVLAPAVRAAHADDDAACAATAAALRALRPRQFGLPTRFWLDSNAGSLPYADAVEELADTTELYSMSRKLGRLLHVLGVMQLHVWAHHGIDEAWRSKHVQLCLTADDLISVVAYVVAQAAPARLPSELAFVDRFGDASLPNGAQSYALGTFRAALSRLRQLAWQESEVAVATRAAAFTARVNGSEASTATTAAAIAPMSSGDTAGAASLALAHGDQQPSAIIGSSPGLAIPLAASAKHSGETRVSERIARARLHRSSILSGRAIPVPPRCSSDPAGTASTPHAEDV